MSKPGRANWPAPGETRTCEVGSPESIAMGQDLSKQIECNLFFKELVSAFGLEDPRFANNHLFAIAANIGMTREEFDRCDDWDLVSRFRVAIATGALRLPPSTPRPAPPESTQTSPPGPRKGRPSGDARKLAVAAIVDSMPNWREDLDELIERLAGESNATPPKGHRTWSDYQVAVGNKQLVQQIVYLIGKKK